MSEYAIEVRKRIEDGVEIVESPATYDIISASYAKVLIDELHELPQAWVHVVSRVLDRAPPEEFIEWRRGPQNTLLAYVTSNYAIATRMALARIGIASDFEVLQTDVSSEACESLCKLTLKYFHNNHWATITAMQWGDCPRRSGMELGSAKKGSATDGLKKCLHELGWAADVYSIEPVRVESPDPKELRQKSIEALYTLGADRGLTSDQLLFYVNSIVPDKTIEELSTVDITTIKRKLKKLSAEDLIGYTPSSEV